MESHPRLTFFAVHLAHGLAQPIQGGAGHLVDLVFVQVEVRGLGFVHGQPPNWT